MSNLTGLIGRCYLGDIIEEASIGKPKLQKWGICDIRVNISEGPIPHFHVVGTNKQCCVCLFEAKYFNHKGAHDYELGPKEMKDLDNFMRMGSGDTGMTNWQIAVSVWARIKGDEIWQYKDTYTTIKQPDYSNISGNIGENKGVAAKRY